MKKVVGIEFVDYINKKGHHIDGYILHYVEDSAEVVGVRANNAFFRGTPEVQLEDVVNIFYNEYKKPVLVVKVK